MSTIDLGSPHWGGKVVSSEGTLPARIAQASSKFFLLSAMFLIISVPSHHDANFQSAGKGQGYAKGGGKYREAYLHPSVESSLPTIDGGTLHALTASLEASRRFQGIIHAAARRYEIDPYLVLGVMKAESNFNTHAVSRRGATGLMQLMPATARMHKVANVYDPEQNIHGGVRHLRLLIDRFEGDLQLAIAAYNAGSKAVKKYQAVPPYSETRNYVKRVFAYYKFYRESELALLGE